MTARENPGKLPSLTHKRLPKYLRIALLGYWIMMLPSACPAFAQPFTLSRSNVTVAIAHGHLPCPISIPVNLSSTVEKVSSLEVRTDVDWLSAEPVNEPASILIKVSRQEFTYRTNLAQVSVSFQGITNIVTISAEFGILDIRKLLDDPLRSWTYGLQWNGDNAGAVLILDRNSMATVGTLTVGARPWDAAFTPDGKEMLVLCEDGTLHELDLVRLHASRVWTLQGFYRPWADAVASIAISRDGLIYYSDASGLNSFDRNTGVARTGLWPELFPVVGALAFRNFALTQDRSKIIARFLWLNEEFRLATAALSDPYPAGRGPVDVGPAWGPILITSDSKTAFMATVSGSTARINDARHTQPYVPLSMTPMGEFLVSSNWIYDAARGLKAAPLPFATSVQSISRDYRFLTLFDPSTRAITNVSLRKLLPALTLESPAAGGLTTVRPSMKWRALPGAQKYRVFLGASHEAVAKPEPHTSVFLAETDSSYLDVPTELAASSEYFWRVDTITARGSIYGEVMPFKTSNFAVTPSTLHAATVKGHQYYRASLSVSNVTPAAPWTASADQPWVMLSSKGGQSPAALEVMLDAEFATAGTNRATIMLSNVLGSVSIPVTFEVRSMHVTHLASHPFLSCVYAVSQQDGSETAYLMAMDTGSETITNVVPVPGPVVGLAVHHLDGKLYLATPTNVFSYELDTLALSGCIPPGMVSNITGLTAAATNRLIVYGPNNIRLVSTPSGRTLQTRWQTGSGVTDLAGTNFYFVPEHGHLEEIDLRSDELQTINTAFFGAPSLPSPPPVVSHDGARVFWGGAALRKDFSPEWNVYQAIITCSEDGRLAFGYNKAWDIVEKSTLPISLPATFSKVYNVESGKLVSNLTNSLHFGAGDAALHFPSDGSMISDVSILKWPAKRGSLLYHVYFGTSVQQVLEADTNSPLLRTSTVNTFVLPQLLPEGTYAWRVDAITPRGTLIGTVHSFDVLNLRLDRTAITATAWTPFSSRASVTISSSVPGEAWVASTTNDWISLPATNGTTPATLELVFSGDLTQGVRTGHVSICTSAGRCLDVEVTLTTASLRPTRLLADPYSVKTYAFCEYTLDGLTRARLLELDSQSEVVLRSVDLAAPPTAVALHSLDRRIYYAIGNRDTSAIIGLDTGTLESAAYYNVSSWWGPPSELCPGPVGRLVWGNGAGLNLLDTVNGINVAALELPSGQCATDPTGRYLHRVEWDGKVRKYDLLADRFTLLSSAATAPGAPNSPIFVLGDSRGIVVNGTVFDSELRTVWASGIPIYAVDSQGTIGFGDGRVADIVNRTLLPERVPPTPVKAYNELAGKLIYDKSNSVGFSSFRTGGESLPSDAAMLSAVTELRWSATGKVPQFHVYLGTNREAVLSAGTNDHQFLGSTNIHAFALPQPLDVGRYYWRVDAVTPSGLVRQLLSTFLVTTLVPDRSQIVFTTFSDMPAKGSLKLTSAVPGMQWSVTTDVEWLQLRRTNGITPSTLEFVAVPQGLSRVTNHGTIKLRFGAGSEIAIPVQCRNEDLDITILKPRRNSPLIYGITEKIYVNETRAFLLEINTVTRAIERSVPVWPRVLDLVFHESDDAIYLAHADPGSITAVRATTFKAIRNYSVSSLALRNIAAGPKGVLVTVQQGGVLSLVSTESGAVLATHSINAGGIPASTTGGDILYYGQTTGFSRAAIQRYSISSNSFALTHEYSFKDTSYRPASLLVSDDEDVFWNRIQFDKNLNRVTEFGEELLAISDSGNLAFSATNVWDTSTRGVVASTPPYRKARAYSEFSGVLVQSAPATVEFTRLFSYEWSTPTGGDVALAITNLIWKPSPLASSYLLYVAQNANELEYVDTNSPAFLAAVATNFVALAEPLAFGRYYWRVDAVTPFGILPGDTREFAVSPVSVFPRALQGAATETGPYETEIRLTTRDATEWYVSTDTPWIELGVTNGAGPGSVGVKMNPRISGAGTNFGSITVRTSDGPALIVPVSLSVYPVRLTMLLSHPSSHIVYGLSVPESISNSASPLLLLLDANKEQVTRVQPLPTGTTNFIYHPGDDKLYVLSSGPRTVQSYDPATLQLLFSRPFSPAVSSQKPYHLSPGPAGRIVILAESGNLLLMDSASGEVITQPYMGTYGALGVSSPDGMVFYRGDRYASGNIRKLRVLTSTLESAGEASSGTNYSPYWPNLYITGDGSRVFWNRCIFDTNLDLVARTSDNIYAVSADGRHAVVANTIVDLAAQRIVLGAPTNGTTFAFNGPTGKIVTQVGNEVRYFSLAESLHQSPEFITNSVSHASVGLTWTDRSLETAFRVEHQATGTPVWNATTVPANTVSFVVAGLLPKTTYEFRVRAEAPGTNSPYSDVLTASTTETPPPAPVVAAVAAYNRTLVRWTTTFRFESFLVQRSVNSTTNFANLALCTGDTAALEDTNVVVGAFYYYRVKGITATNESSFSAHSGMKVPDPAPPANPTITARPSATNQIFLAWSSVLGATAYSVERRTENQPDWVLLASLPANITNFTDTVVLPEVEYMYRVVSSNGIGRSTNSASVAFATGRNMAALFEETFDPVLASGLWTAIEGGLVTNAGIGFGSSQVLWFGGSAQDRSATTIPLPLSGEAWVDFRLRAGNSQADGTNFWDNSETGESVVLEYSTAPGQWTLAQSLNSVFPGYASWSNLSFRLPQAAMSAQTQVRWRQIKHSGAGLDVWGIDDVQIHTAAPALPSAPAFLLASVRSSTAVDLYWSEAARAMSYVIQRAPVSGSWSTVSNLSASQNFFTDDQAMPGTSYRYRVQAANFSGVSPFSQVTFATTWSQKQEWISSNSETLGGMDDGVLEERDPHGVPYILNFAFNVPAGTPLPPYEPSSASGRPAIWLNSSNNTLVVEFAVRKASTKPGIEYRVEFSDNLVDWRIPTEVTRTPIDRIWERVVVQHWATPSKAAFFRVSIVNTP